MEGPPIAVDCSPRVAPPQGAFALYVRSLVNGLHKATSRLASRVHDTAVADAAPPPQACPSSSDKQHIRSSANAFNAGLLAAMAGWVSGSNYSSSSVDDVAEELEWDGNQSELGLDEHQHMEEEVEEEDEEGKEPTRKTSDWPSGRLVDTARAIMRVVASVAWPALVT